MVAEPDEVSRLIDRLEDPNTREVSWTQLYNIALPVVRRVAEISFRNDPATQDDVVQATLTRVLTARALKSLRTKAALLAFARTVAVNEVRRAGATRTRAGRNASLDEVDPPSQAHGDLHESLELGELVELALATVSNLDRRILKATMDGFSASEVANELHISTVNVGVRLHRMRLVLRAHVLARYLAD